MSVRRWRQAQSLSGDARSFNRRRLSGVFALACEHRSRMYRPRSSSFRGG